MGIAIMEGYDKVYAEADLAGKEAVKLATIAPMVVEEHTNMLDDCSPVRKSYYVADGPCGFAWVNVKPGNSAFAKWLKTNGYARTDSYYGGVTIWISAYNQSMQKKEIYAHEMARVFTKYGIRAHASSRMD